jgi:hypothetical protein
MQPLTITFDFSLITGDTLVIAVAGYCIVLLALAVMALFFSRLHHWQDVLARRRMAAKATAGPEEKPRVVMSGEENAAIAAALYLFFSELHDEEKYVMTIRKVSRTYSPWSSKIYGVMNKMKHW